MPTATQQDPATTGEGQMISEDHLAELRAARAAEGLPPEGPDGSHPQAADDDGSQGPVELVLTGTGQLGFAVGGKRVTDATLRLLGGKIDVEGSFGKGDVLVLRVEAVVGKVAFVDKVDSKTNQVTGCERQHGARIVGLSIEEKHAGAPE